MTRSIAEQTTDELADYEYGLWTTYRELQLPQDAADVRRVLRLISHVQLRRRELREEVDHAAQEEAKVPLLR